MLAEDLDTARWTTNHNAILKMNTYTAACAIGNNTSRTKATSYLMTRVCSIAIIVEKLFTPYAKPAPLTSDLMTISLMYFKVITPCLPVNIKLLTLQPFYIAFFTVTCSLFEIGSVLELNFKLVTFVCNRRLSALSFNGSDQISLGS